MIGKHRDMQTKAEGAVKVDRPRKAEVVTKLEKSDPEKPRTAGSSISARPPAPFGTPENPPPTTLYKGGKVHVSHRLQSYRVFVHASDKVDKAVKWSTNGGHINAWVVACEMIETANAATSAKRAKTE